MARLSVASCVRWVVVLGFYYNIAIMLIHVRLIPHLLAGALALLYAWGVAQTQLLTTGLQFVAPLLIIIAVHLAWLAWVRELVAGFSLRLYQRSVLTAGLIAGVLFVSTVFAPKPAHADTGEIVGMLLMVVFCAAMIAAVVGAVAIGLYLIGRIFFWLIGFVTGRGPKNRMYDVASLSVAVGLLGVASLEGLPGGFAFSTQNQVRAAHVIQATPDHVWQTLQTATSPDFPLPSILSVFPRPVEVSTDEGVDLGAMRIVRFEGREGEGFLTLQVTERTPTMAAFTVLSDTSPFADWIGHRALTYHVVPEAGGVRLTVSLDYDRKLAPAWFFDPVMEAATVMAVDVLARDVKARAEG